MSSQGPAHLHTITTLVSGWGSSPPHSREAPQVLPSLPWLQVGLYCPPFRCLLANAIRPAGLLLTLAGTRETSATFPSPLWFSPKMSKSLQ